MLRSVSSIGAQIAKVLLDDNRSHHSTGAKSHQIERWWQ